MKFLWEKDRGEAVLVRAYGNSPVVEIPEEIDGYPVTAIGAYCFSDRSRGRDAAMRPPDLSDDFTELAGGFVEQVILPDSLRRIENAAFFNCRGLREIVMGGGELTIGSDVFNNCTKLKKAVVRGSVSKPSGAKQLLARISWDMEVHYADAVVFYPEYYETYDTIAPAHIFGLSIEGEGFRARQCFRGDVVDFVAYDDIFGKAQAEESVETLAKMALNRLMTPVDLTEERKHCYENYVREKIGEIMSFLIREKELEQLEFVCRSKYVTGAQLEEGVVQAIESNWSEGVVHLLDWKKKYGSVDKKKRYEF